MEITVRETIKKTILKHLKEKVDAGADYVVTQMFFDNQKYFQFVEAAKKEGIKVEVRPIKVSEIVEAQKNGQLKEIFGSGTAVIVLPIVGFGYENEKYDLPKIENPFSTFLKKKLNDIQYNISDDPFNWRVEA